jgi:hypothetical protein
MISSYSLTRISPPGVEAIHFYYDVTPESPDGTKVAYFEFGTKAADSPGAGTPDFSGGNVVVAGRDGRGHRRLAAVSGSETHSGARVQWVDDDTVAWCEGGPGSLRTVMLSLHDGARRQIDGALRMENPRVGGDPLGLTCRHDFAPIADPYDDCVHLMDLAAGTHRALFTLGQAMRLHPRGTQFPGCELLTFMHTKWSGDGERFFVMASNGHRVAGRPECKAVHAVFVADADGSNLRYVTEEYHHPMWGADADTGKPLICYFERRADGGGQDLMAFDPADGRRRRLVERMLGKHACVTRGGDRIVTDVIHWPQKHHGAIMVYRPGHDEPDVAVRLRQDDFSQRGCHQHPTWSRDERRVYFNTSEDGRRGVWAVDLA